MGQDNGKPVLSGPEAYFRQQLSLYRWRSDPNFNTHLARVTFTSKQRLEGRNKLQSLLQTQLQQQNYIQVTQLTSLAQQELWNDTEEVMSFEQYSTNLQSFRGELTLEEMLYVLQVLLLGSQQIFYKMRKVHIAANCCFLTARGEVRVWINPNPSLNQFVDNCDLQLSEPTAVNQIIRICRRLIKERQQFAHFQQQLSSHLQRDLLHHSGFSELRKFMNGYVYHHRLALPQNLEKAMKRIKQKSCSLHVTPHNTVRSGHQQRQSSLSELVGPEQQWGSRLLSTDINLLKAKTSVQWSVQQQQIRQIGFYRPCQTHEKKLSTLDINCPRYSKKSLNRSDIQSKHSGEMSVSSSFSKKQQRCQVEVCHLASPKNMSRTRTGLESTSGESFLCHSKDPSGLTASKLGQSSSTMNFFQTRNSNPKFQRKNGSMMETFPQATFLKPSPQHYHSKQPSFDENSSSLFVSPASEMVHNENPSYRQPDLSKIQAISESQQSQASQKSQPNLSTRGQMSPSQLLTRQVSALVQNQQINTFQSRGSFLSYQDSISSEYKGMLMGLCRSAKVLNVPTRKNIQKRNSRRHSKAVHLN